MRMTAFFAKKSSDIGKKTQKITHITSDMGKKTSIFGHVTTDMDTKTQKRIHVTRDGAMMSFDDGTGLKTTPYPIP